VSHGHPVESDRCHTDAQFAETSVNPTPDQCPTDAQTSVTQTPQVHKQSSQEVATKVKTEVANKIKSEDASLAGVNGLESDHPNTHPPFTSHNASPTRARALRLDGILTGVVDDPPQQTLHLSRNVPNGKPWDSSEKRQARLRAIDRRIDEVCTLTAA